jgi:hypothetical protein
MIRIRADESLFIISKNSIDKYPESKLSKILTSNNQDVQYIHKEHRDDTITLYIDADPNITKNIVRLLRGGKLPKDFDDMDFLRHTLVNLDLERLIQIQYSPYEKQIGGNIDSQYSYNINEINLNSEPTDSHIEKIGKIFEQPNDKTNINDFTEFSFDVQANLESVLSSATKDGPKKRKMRTKNMSLENNT